MNGTKAWTQSSGVVGPLAAIVGLIVNLLNHFGVHFGLSNAELIDMASTIVATCGAVAGILGRIYATTTIVSRKTAKNAAKAAPTGAQQ